ncbi:MAG TPA: low molecular weight protein-tyrosine-phosphatase [Streptosporangiaceae bacterium]
MPDHVAVPGVPPQPRNPNGNYRILAVCLGNICRSPTAEVVLRAELTVAGLTSAVEIESAGTGDWHLGLPMDQGARAELAERGYDGSRHRARQLNGSWLGRFDLILAMDRYNLADLRAMATDEETAGYRIRLLRTFDPDSAAVAAGGSADPHDGEVPDPYHGTLEDYALSFDLIRAACIGLAAQLTRLLGERPRSPMG